MPDILNKNNIENNGIGSQEKIINILESLTSMLLEKNNRYGDSALTPLNIFGKFVDKENDQGLNSILIRLDDKLSRIKNAKELRKNDISDLMGYLTLLCISRNWNDFSDLID